MMSCSVMTASRRLGASPRWWYTFSIQFSNMSIRLSSSLCAGEAAPTRTACLCPSIGATESIRALSTAPPPASESSQTSSSSFFGYTSGRARRRRRRLLRYQQRQKKIEENMKSDNNNTINNQQSTWGGGGYVDESNKEDTRTVMDILFPNPYKHEKPEEGVQIIWPKTPSEWKFVLTETWEDYKWTWRGFMTSKGFFVEDETDVAEAEKKRQDQHKHLKTKAEEVKAQTKANAEFIKEEALNLRQQVRDHTGIHSQEDLRKWAADMMRLASECVNEFMKGYRKGRDDEVEKMLTEYFQEIEKEAGKKRKRKAKRRILNRRHPLVN